MDERAASSCVGKLIQAYAIFVASLPLLILMLCSPLLGLPVLALFLAALWRRPRDREISLSTRTLGDRLAWLCFSAGITVMYGVVVVSIVSEGDGDYRSWDQIRLHTSIFLTAGYVAAAVPVFVATWELLTNRRTSKTPRRGDDETLAGE
jgi:hypothetical protein